jgi:hypothetical protein
MTCRPGIRSPNCNHKRRIHEPRTQSCRRCIHLGMAALLAGPQGLAKSEPYSPVIDPENFTTKIDNLFLPLQPGTVFTYRGVTDAGLELQTVEATHSTRVLMGVKCVEVIDTVFLQGNVEYFGEDSKELANGEVVSSAGSWLAGVDGGPPGMVMEADPQVGDSYRREYQKDVAEVIGLDGTAAVPNGTFAGCVVAKEFTPLERKSVENKWYARGIGMVRSERVRGGVDISELVSIK